MRGFRKNSSVFLLGSHPGSLVSNLIMRVDRVLVHAPVPVLAAVLALAVLALAVVAVAVPAVAVPALTSVPAALA